MAKLEEDKIIRFGKRIQNKLDKIFDDYGISYTMSEDKSACEIYPFCKKPLHLCGG
jgi:hypothetical protein